VRTGNSKLEIRNSKETEKDEKEKVVARKGLDHGGRAMRTSGVVCCVVLLLSTTMTFAEDAAEAALDVLLRMQDSRNTKERTRGVEAIAYVDREAFSARRLLPKAYAAALKVAGEDIANEQDAYTPKTVWNILQRYHEEEKITPAESSKIAAWGIREMSRHPPAKYVEHDYRWAFCCGQWRNADKKPDLSQLKPDTCNAQTLNILTAIGVDVGRWTRVVPDDVFQSEDRIIPITKELTESVSSDQTHPNTRRYWDRPALQLKKAGWCYEVRFHKDLVAEGLLVNEAKKCTRMLKEQFVVPLLLSRSDPCRQVLEEWLDDTGKLLEEGGGTYEARQTLQNAVRFECCRVLSELTGPFKKPLHEATTEELKRVIREYCLAGASVAPRSAPQGGAQER
jgi:hypothetical protein